MVPRTVAGTDCGNKNDSCGPFIAANLAPPPNTPCTTSVLSVVGTPPVNGTNVSCYSNNILQSSFLITITGIIMYIRVFVVVYLDTSVHLRNYWPDVHMYSVVKRVHVFVPALCEYVHEHYLCEHAYMYLLESLHFLVTRMQSEWMEFNSIICARCTHA